MKYEFSGNTKEGYCIWQGDELIARSGSEQSAYRIVTALNDAKLPNAKCAPVFIGDVVGADCSELREIAEWFELRGMLERGKYLKKLADRYEIVFGAYWTATKDISTVNKEGR